MPYDYLYNEKTHVMHISGLCPNAQPLSLKHYQNEDAAAQDGARFVMCKTCSKKRDILMRESQNK